jgi:arylsulfatase B
MAMVNFLDDMVGQVVAALKKKGMWENLLWATNSDNVSICINFAKGDG